MMLKDGTGSTCMGQNEYEIQQNRTVARALHADGDSHSKPARQYDLPGEHGPAGPGHESGGYQDVKFPGLMLTKTVWSQ